MQPKATSRPAILAAARDLVRRQGWDTLNIRSLAAACGVSVGTLYHYFDSKAELMAATVESVWQEIFCPGNGIRFTDTKTCIVWLFQRLSYGRQQYPGFFTMHLSRLPSSEGTGQPHRDRVWQHMTGQLTEVIRQDPHVRPGAFSDAFPPEAFARLLFSFLLAALIEGQDDPSAILTVTQRTLYDTGS